MLFRYTLRNLLLHRSSSVPTALAIMATIAMVTGLLGILEGLYATILNSGIPDNVIVLSEGASVESESAIDLPALAKIKIAPGVSSSEGQQLISVEYVTLLSLRTVDGHLGTLTLRGVDPAAYLVHRVEARGGLPDGQSNSGVLAGDRQLDRFALLPGDNVLIGRKSWPVVGTLVAPGSKFGSELWADRQALMTERHRIKPTAVVVRLSSADQFPAFAAAVHAIADQRLTAVTETQYYHRLSEGLEPLFKAVLLMLVVVILGAIAACSAAMYTLFLGRVRELATLLAIGFQRGRVGLLIVMESVWLALAGGGVGVALMIPFAGRSLSIGSLGAGLGVGDEQMPLVYNLIISGRVALAAAAVSLLIGLVGGLLPFVYVLRLRVVEAIHD